MQSLYYKASGRFSPLALILVPLSGLLAALLLGSTYAYIAVYNPLIYITILATIGYGVGQGFALAIGARIGKLRSPMVMIILALLVSAASLYITWVVWMHAFLARADLEIWPFEPVQLWELMTLVAEKGAWSIKSLTPTGALLYTFWGIEALVIVGGTLMMALGQPGEPFCERCELWMEENEGATVVPGVSDRGSLRMELEAGRFEALLSGDQNNPYLSIKVHSCPGCKRVGTLEVQELLKSVNKKGEEEVKTKDLIQHLKLEERGLEMVQAQIQESYKPLDSAQQE